jgi:NAD(P)-dependent dehydrogenase (short-subunit alcohol dehydrogenase family)
MNELTDKVAVVTGAGSGIGRALAGRFAAEGMRVAVADVDAAGLDATAEALVDATPGLELVAVPTDVRDAEQVGALADRAFDAFGQVDLLCNNAGVFVGGLMWERPPEDFAYCLDVNLWGILHGIRAFVPRMIDQGTEGYVVNTVSVAGLFGSPYAGPYGISKFAALAATEALAGDLAAVGSRIRASALCPGIISTGIVENSDRNRPADSVTDYTDDRRFVTDHLASIIGDGVDPAHVADVVVRGIRGDDFLFLTHDHHAAPLVTRGEELAARRLPAMVDFT